MRRMASRSRDGECVCAAIKVFMGTTDSGTSRWVCTGFTERSYWRRSVYCARSRPVWHSLLPLIVRQLDRKDDRPPADGPPCPPANHFRSFRGHVTSRDSSSWNWCRACLRADWSLESVRTSSRRVRCVKRGFQPTQRAQRKERDEMAASLLDRPITAASDYGVCRWHAAKLWQTRAKLLKLSLICIISCTTSNKRTKMWTIDRFFLIFKP